MQKLFDQTGQSSIHILKQVYHMTRQIARNDIKTIWQVSHLYTGDVSVAKTQHMSSNITNQRSVLHEGRFLQNCQGSPGIPFLVWCGKDQIKKLGILIQQKLGKTLFQLQNQQKIYNQFKQRQKASNIKLIYKRNIKLPSTLFTLKTITMIALQLIKMISCYHQKGYIFRNINMKTLQFGCGSRCDRLYFNDFIDSRSFYKKNTLQHIDKKINLKLKKINQFMSYDVLNGIEPGRKDDLQAIMYVLVHLAKGQLPWGKLFYEDAENDGYTITKKQKKHNQSPLQLKDSSYRIIQSKKNLAQKITAYINGNYNSFKIQKKAQILRQIMSSVSARQLFSGLPLQYLQIYEEIRQLQFNSRPNYIFYIQKLEAVLIKNGWENDHVYDWMKHERIQKDQNKGGLSVRELQWLVYKPNNRNMNFGNQKSKQKDDNFNKLSKLQKQDEVLKIYQKYAPFTEIDKFREP